MNKKHVSDVPIIRPVKRSDPDVRKLARALIALAIAENKNAKPDEAATDDGPDGEEFGVAS